MNTLKPLPNETGRNTLFEIASDLEGILVSLQQANNILRVFDARMEDDVKELAKGDDWRSKWFASRYDVSRSLMEVMISKFDAAIQDMDEKVRRIYSASDSSSPELHQDI